MIEQAKERFGFECGQIVTADTTLDREPARTMTWSCAIYFVQNVQVVHAGKGYVVALGVPTSAGIDAKKVFADLLASFRFGP